MACINRHRRGYYIRREGENKIFKQSRFPNWKLVSKNKKQWQKKPVTYTTEGDGLYVDNIAKITW